MDSALARDPSLRPVAHRLRPRFQRLQGAAERELLCWGEENLQGVVECSKAQARVASALQSLQVSTAVERCQRESTDTGGVLNRFFGPKPRTPDQHEVALRGCQRAMAPLIEELVRVQDRAAQETEDLRVDMAALAEVAPRYTDASLQMVVQNRLRILAGGMQASAQLAVQVEATRMTILQNCQVIDQLLSVTLPAWRMSR